MALPAWPWPPSMFHSSHRRCRCWFQLEGKLSFRNAGQSMEPHTLWPADCGRLILILSTKMELIDMAREPKAKDQETRDGAEHRLYASIVYAGAYSYLSATNGST